jgi:hypothetical protein
MFHFRRLLMLCLPLALALLAEASAQPRDARPGTICITPQSWCRAVQPGPPGAPCACQTSNGWIRGVLR